MFVIIYRNTEVAGEVVVVTESGGGGSSSSKARIAAREWCWITAVDCRDGGRVGGAATCSSVELAHDVTIHPRIVLGEVQQVLDRKMLLLVVVERRGAALLGRWRGSAVSAMEILVRCLHYRAASACVLSLSECGCCTLCRSNCWEKRLGWKRGERAHGGRVCGL